MRFSTGIGQYVPADSAVHRLHPGAKLAVTVGFGVTIFTLDAWVGLATAALLVVLAVQGSRVPWAVALRGVRAVTVLLAITVIAHAVRWEPATVALLRAGPFAVDASGLLDGAYFAGRIVLLVVGGSLLTLTTSPVALADALEDVLRPLERLRFPAHDVAMMLTIALRFIPVTAAEAERITDSQRARGARLGRGGPLGRIRSYLPVLVPLFVALFRRADRLATAMEARCYCGGGGRTRLRESRMRGRDWSVVLVTAVVLVAMGVAL